VGCEAELFKRIVTVALHAVVKAILSGKSALKDAVVEILTDDNPNCNSISVDCIFLSTYKIRQHSSSKGKGLSSQPSIFRKYLPFIFTQAPWGCCLVFRSFFKYQDGDKHYWKS
jgi:hypothetical protein